MMQAGTLYAVPDEDTAVLDTDVAVLDADDTIAGSAADFDGDDARDADVVRRFQRGEVVAFVELYERHFSRIYGYLRVLLRDHHEAEDAAQQAFTKAYQALGGFELRSGKPFRCWLFKIARNEALNHMRKQGRIHVELTERIELHIDGPCPPDSLRWLSDAEVLGFIERLPETQRHVLALRYGLSMSTREVAEVLNRSPVAIRKLEHRALRFLEHRLAAVGRRGTGHVERAASLMRLRRAPVLRARRFVLLPAMGFSARFAR